MPRTTQNSPSIPLSCPFHDPLLACTLVTLSLLLPHERIEKHFLFCHLWGSQEPHSATLRGKNTLMTTPALFPVSKNISDQPPNPGTFKPSSGTRRFCPTQRHLASCDSSKVSTPLPGILFWFFSTPGTREQDHRSIETSGHARA